MPSTPPTTPGELGRETLALCRGAGFALAGITDCSPSRRAEELRAWLAARRHGTMSWLAETAENRVDPARALRGARSAVMVADQYATRGRTADGPATATHGRIARYARGRDYHRVMKRRLHAVCDALRERHPGERFRAFVDTAPVPERELAARSGLGWIGKHTLLIHPERGSWLLLGGFLTTMELRDPDAATVTDHCGTCTRCIDACPTSAISAYSVDASRCISYLTIERREPIGHEFCSAIGDWLFGCDICQEVCPHNSARPDGAGVGSTHPAYESMRGSLDLLAVLNWKPADRSDALTGSAIKRATLDMMRRNAALVAGNALARERGAGGDFPELVARLEKMAGDPGEGAMVRDAARRALDRLTPRGAA